MSKTITVLGNAGKTMLSYFLAQKLAIKGKRAVIVATQNDAPSMQLILPEDKKVNRSLGRILSFALISSKDILDNMITLPKEENIGFLSYTSYENKNTYPEISRANLATFFELLSHLVDYVIVDTQTSRNDIDTFAMENSDAILCITSADMKGFAYRQHLPETPITHLLFNCSPLNPYEDIAHTFKQHMKYNVPLCKPLMTLYNIQTLVDLTCPVKYSKVIDKVIKEVIDIE